MQGPVGPLPRKFLFARIAIQSPPSDMAALRPLDLNRLRDLGARYLAPERPRLDEVRRAVGATRRKTEVWERLATRDLIPPEWVENPGRRFAVEPLRPWSSLPTASLSATPTSVEAMVTLASDVSGVLRAEEAVLEWHNRWRVLWAGPRLDGFLWRVLPRVSDRWAQSSLQEGHETTFYTEMRRAFESSDGDAGPGWLWERLQQAYDAAQGGLAQRFGVLPQRDRVAAGLERALNLCAYSPLLRGVRFAVLFDCAQWTGKSITREMARHGAPLGRSFADLLNPFGAVLDVFSAGYVLQGIREDDEARRWAMLTAHATDETKLPRTAFSRSP